MWAYSWAWDRLSASSYHNPAGSSSRLYNLTPAAKVSIRPNISQGTSELSSTLNPPLDLTRLAAPAKRPSITTIPTTNSVTAAPKQYHARERLSTLSCPKFRSETDIRRQAVIVEAQPRSLRVNSTFQILKAHSAGLARKSKDSCDWAEGPYGFPFARTDSSKRHTTATVRGATAQMRPPPRMKNCANIVKRTAEATRVNRRDAAPRVSHAVGSVLTTSDSYNS